MLIMSNRTEASLRSRPKQGRIFCGMCQWSVVVAFVAGHQPLVAAEGPSPVVNPSRRTAAAMSEGAASARRTSGADVQMEINAVLGLSPCTVKFDGSSTCDVADVQQIINSLLTSTCPRVSALQITSNALPASMIGIPRFVNLTWPTLILSFGPPAGPKDPLCLFLLSVAPAGAKPCAAFFAARRGRSAGRGYRERAIRI